MTQQVFEGLSWQDRRGASESRSSNGSAESADSVTRFTTVPLKDGAAVLSFRGQGKRIELLVCRSSYIRDSLCGASES